MASNTSEYLALSRDARGTGVASTPGESPSEVVFSSTSPFSSPDCNSSQSAAEAPGTDRASSSALARVRLTTTTLAPLSAAPKARALPAPPAPTTTAVSPVSALSHPPRPCRTASMAAFQSVLYPFHPPPDSLGSRTRVLTAPMDRATGSTSAQAARRPPCAGG